MTIPMLLLAIWTTPPPPIQGFDRWEPAALFKIVDGLGEERYVDEGPNHERLNVTKLSWEVRSYLEFDLETLPEEFDAITLNILIANLDAGPPVEVVEFFHYTGDGEEDLEDWDAGELFWTHDYEYPDAGVKYAIKLEVTELVRRYRDEGRRFLGFRLSAPGFARFRIGKAGGITSPNPFFAVHHAGARTDILDFVGREDLVSFEECMAGPYGAFAVCTVIWDYDGDEFVDLADFAIFQAMFEE